MNSPFGPWMSDGGIVHPVRKPDVSSAANSSCDKVLIASGRLPWRDMCKYRLIFARLTASDDVPRPFKMNPLEGDARRWPFHEMPTRWMTASQPRHAASSDSGSKSEPLIDSTAQRMK